MTDERITLHCPKCGNSSVELTDDLDPDGPFTCAGCGASLLMGELKTAAGQTLLEHSAEMLRYAFKGIKGFKFPSS